MEHPAGLVSDADSLLRSVLASSGDCIKILDLDGNLLFMTEGGQRIMEVTDFNAIRGCPWPDFWQGQGHIDVKAALEAARAGRAAQFQGFAKTMAGTPKWWDVQVTPVLGPDGKPERLLSVSRDITAARSADQARELLTYELEHRMRNTLAMVGAIASQTFRTAATLGEAGAIFQARLQALSHAHDILTKSSWTSASMPIVVEGALAPHRSGEGRIRISGPQVELTAKQALSLALALHELATNATKYGALSVPDGKIDVSWECPICDESQVLRFEWRESGGPTVAVPTRRGFGSRLIERTLSSDFGGATSIAYLPEGVICRFETKFSDLASGAH